MAPQGSHLPTLEGGAGHTINLTYGVGGTGRGSGLLSPLLAAAGGCQEKQTPSPSWPDWAGRQRKRKGLEDSDIVSLRFLQANPLEVNYYSRCPQREKIPANIYGML